MSNHDTHGVLGSVKRNVRWGVLWGLYLAVAFSVVAAIPALIRAFLSSGSGWQKGLTFLEIIGFYLLAGVLAGAFVGLLRDLTKWWIARRLLGIIVGVPIMFGVRILVYGSGGWTGQDVRAWIFAGVVWGVAMSFAPEPWAKNAR